MNVNFRQKSYITRLILLKYKACVHMCQKSIVNTELMKGIVLGFNVFQYDHAANNKRGGLGKNWYTRHIGTCPVTNKRKRTGL